MYIEYKTARWCYRRDSTKILVETEEPLKAVPDSLPKTEFMPSKLVRISDMKVVNSSQVNEGYCTLSYSWNQSGDMVLDEATGKSIRIDEGKHKIISPDKILSCEEVIPYTKTFENHKLWRINTVLGTILKDYIHLLQNVKYVKFEGVIQQICQQTNINYIWYDQMCINQDNKKEKQREIRNMHHIYSNAYCTVALLPEALIFRSTFEDIRQCEWFKRLWTLEEALKSKRLLFIMNDCHIWGEEVADSSIIYGLRKPLSQTNVCEILYHAHQRTSTKEHDRVFALIHLFPDIMDMISVDYDQSIEDLMIRFYGLLAKKSINMLAFQKSSEDYNSTIQKYKFLPSWTGFHGQYQYWINTISSFQNYDIIGNTMHVTCSYLTNNQQLANEDSLDISYDDLPPIQDNQTSLYKLNVNAQIIGTNKTIMFQISSQTYVSFDSKIHKEDYFKSDHSLASISTKLKILSKFMKIKKQNLCWILYTCNDPPTTFHFDDLTEAVNDDFSRYVLLSGIPFKDQRPGSKSNWYYYPIIKKKQGETYYKAIGTCYIEDPPAPYVFTHYCLPKQKFLIQ